MNFPKELKYTKDHEWAKRDGNIATVGITSYACEALGDIVFLDLPPVGKNVKEGDVIGSVESVKAVSDIFSPVSGVVTQVNESQKEHLDGIVKDPHSSAWLVKIEMSVPQEWESLLNVDAYAAHVQTSH